MRRPFQTVVSPLSLFLTKAWVLATPLLHLCINEKGGGREGKGVTKRELGFL